MWSHFSTGFWVIIVTMTTVGYGDFSPVSHGGRFAAAFAVLAFSIVLALVIATLHETTTLRQAESRVYTYAMKNTELAELRHIASQMIAKFLRHRQIRRSAAARRAASMDDKENADHKWSVRGQNEDGGRVQRLTANLKHTSKRIADSFDRSSRIFTGHNGMSETATPGQNVNRFGIPNHLSAKFKASMRMYNQMLHDSAPDESQIMLVGLQSEQKKQAYELHIHTDLLKETRKEMRTIAKVIAELSRQVQRSAVGGTLEVSDMSAELAGVNDGTQMRRGVMAILTTRRMKKKTAEEWH